MATSVVAWSELLIVSARLHHDGLDLRDTLLRHFLPLIEVVLTVIVLQEAPDVLRLPQLSPSLAILTTLNIFVNQESKLNGRATKALGLKLMPKLVFNAIAIFDDVFGDFNLNLDTDGLK